MVNVVKLNVAAPISEKNVSKNRFIVCSYSMGHKSVCIHGRYNFCYNGICSTDDGPYDEETLT